MREREPGLGWGRGPGKSYLQSIYFLLHDHNPTITPNDHSHELLDLNAYKYEPYTKRTCQNYCKRRKVCTIQNNIANVLHLNKQEFLTLNLTYINNYMQIKLPGRQ